MECSLLTSMSVRAIAEADIILKLFSILWQKNCISGRSPLKAVTIQPFKFCIHFGSFNAWTFCSPGDSKIRFQCNLSWFDKWKYKICGMQDREEHDAITTVLISHVIYFSSSDVKRFADFIFTLVTDFWRDFFFAWIKRLENFDLFNLMWAMSSEHQLECFSSIKYRCMIARILWKIEKKLFYLLDYFHSVGSMSKIMTSLLNEGNALNILFVSFPLLSSTEFELFEFGN